VVLRRLRLRPNLPQQLLNPDLVRLNLPQQDHPQGQLQLEASPNDLLLLVQQLPLRQRRVGVHLLFVAVALRVVPLEACLIVLSQLGRQLHYQEESPSWVLLPPPPHPLVVPLLSDLERTEMPVLGRIRLLND
jgi:hypothetical protein